MSAEPLPSRIIFPLKAIPARAKLDRTVTLPDYLPARMLNEFVYCPRLFFYEWVEGVFAASADTVEGGLRHGRIDAKETALPAAESIAAEPIHARSVTLSSDALGLIAKIDLVEGDGGIVSPVDYKKGAPRKTDAGIDAWPADRMQVGVQALVLREHGYRCDEAILYYDETRQRVRVPVDDQLAADVASAAAAARTLAARGRIPPPLADSPKCPRCSLVGICLPDETLAAIERRDEEDEIDPPQPSLFDEPLGRDARIRDEEIRRLVPARDDLRPVYVTGYGFSLGKKGDVLQVRDKKEVVQEMRFNDVSQVNVFGMVSVSSAVVQALCEAEKPIAYFSFGGWFYGLTHGLGLKNVFLRRDQFRRAEEEPFCLRVARDIVSSKIRNQRTLLQRNHIEPPVRAIEGLKRMANRALEADSLEALLGVEGTAAHLYFASLNGMLKVDDDESVRAFDFTTRNRRPPRDPINALLSLGYSLLARDLTIICHAVGFDPFIGFYHQPRFGRPALALDLMEGFRPLIVDSAVLTAINTGMVKVDDFQEAGLAVALTARGRKRFITAYEQRMDTLVTHPIFGYRASYRRVLEIQTRLLARVVTGELGRYPGFETR